MLWLLMGAASFVLLIACANVANLMLARIARREHELVVRSAMGAATSRLLRQFLTESLLIATLAAAVGVLFASASMRLLTDFAARLTPRAREIALDQSALLYAIAVAVATTLLFGSLAALCTRKDLSSNLKEGNFTWRPSRVRMRNILVICQVAFSFLLLTGAGLLSRSIVKLMGVDPGFAVEKTFAVGIDLNWTAYASEQVRGKLAASLLDKLRSEPAITSAALSSSYPFDSDAVTCCGWEVSFRTDATSSGAVAVMRSASSGYFQTLGVPILAGRAFTPEDQADGPPVAIVSRQLASRSWPGETAIGKRLSYDHRQLWIKVVGVVGDVKEYGLSRATPDEIYRPLAQMETRIGAILVRSTASADVVSNVARQVIRDVDPEIAIARIEPVDRARTDSIRVNTVATGLLGMFAIIALAIALTGVGGILALSVSRRMREIAIRMALGAKPANLLLMIIRQGMSPVLIGLALSWAAAAALTSMLTTLLFNVAPTDPVTFLGVSLLLCLAALVACYIPAWRALRIDPHVALRAD